MNLYIVFMELLRFHSDILTFFFILIPKGKEKRFLNVV